MQKVIYFFLMLFMASCSLAQTYKIGTGVKVKWGEFWYQGNIIAIGDNKYKIHYDGYGSNYDDWRTKEELVMLDTKKENEPPATATTPKSVAVKDIAQTAPATGLPGKLYLRTSYFMGSLSISTIFLSNKGVIVKDAKNGVDPLDVEKEKKR